MKAIGYVAVAMTLMTAGTAVRPAAARAGVPAGAAPAAGRTGTAPATALPNAIAYVRGGDVYVTRGTAETRLTTDGGYARPRWSADGRQLAVLKDGQLWVMRADGSGRRRLSTRPASGPSWSPDGRWIAFASLSCTGGPGVYRISTTTADPTPEVLFPRECQEQPLPSAPVGPAPRRSGSLTDRLRGDDAVAWSPDGTRVAFRGGQCDAVYDSCLTIGTIATGAERTVAAYGGGGSETRGFAVVPSWRTDGARLAWTAYQAGETVAENQPLHVVEYDPSSGRSRTVGSTGDREMVYLDANRGVVTGQHAGGSWIVLVGLRDGTRTLLRAGSQPSVSPQPR